MLVGTRKSRGVTLVSVVLGTPSLAARDQDSLALLRWGEDRYEKIRPVIAGTIVATPEIRYRRGATIPLITSGSVTRVVPAGAEITANDVGRARDGDRARCRAGSASATARCSRTASGSPRCRSSPARSFPRRDLPQRTKDWFTRPPALLLAGAVLVGTVLLARRVRRRPPPRRRTSRSEPEAA